MQDERRRDCIVKSREDKGRTIDKGDVEVVGAKVARC